jgi:hypothetical protein
MNKYRNLTASALVKNAPGVLKGMYVSFNVGLYATIANTLDVTLHYE